MRIEEGHGIEIKSGATMKIHWVNIDGKLYGSMEDNLRGNDEELNMAYQLSLPKNTDLERLPVAGVLGEIDLFNGPK